MQVAVGAADVRAQMGAPINKLSLDAVAREHLKLAGDATSRRSAATVYGGHEHALSQTVMALTAGATIAEHENPGDATLLVVVGRVRLSGGGDAWEGRPGDLIAIPPSRHSLEALEDSAVLLTVARTR